MIAKIKHIIIITTIFFIGLVFYSCKNKEPKQFDFDAVKKEINKLPTNKRVAKWDSLIKLHQNDTLTGYLFFNRAYCNFFNNEYDEAINYFIKAQKKFSINRNERMLAEIYIRLGTAYNEKEEYKLGSKYLFKGIKLAMKFDDADILSPAYNELARIYYTYKEYDKSIAYLKKILAIAKKNNEVRDLVTVYNNIAIIYQEQGQNKKALEYLFKIIKLDIKNKIEPYNLLVFYDNLAFNTFNVTKDKSKALKYVDKSLKIARQNGLKPITTYEFLSKMYYELNQPDSAKYYLHKAINLNDKDKHKELIEMYDMLIQIELKQKKDTSILKMIRFRDSINDLYEEKIKNNSKNALKWNMKTVHQQKELLQVQKINKKNRIIFIFIIVMFVLGLIISFQFNRFDILKHKQEVFILEQKVLRSQMNPHFIFNVLSSIQNSLIEKNTITSVTYLSKFAKLIRQNFDFIQKKQILLKEELDMIQNYLDTQKFRFKDKFDYQINIDDKISSKEYLIPPMILQPFIENSIEHGFKNISYKGLVTINIKIIDNKLCFEIIDNGSGYEPKKDDKEHALDIFKKRLLLLGKEIYDSFKITRLQQGTKVVFCFDIIKA